MAVHIGRQLEYDCKFLEARGIMDYSMLLGLHFRAPQYRAPLSPGPSSTPDVPPSESFTSTALDEGICSGKNRLFGRCIRLPFL